MRDYYSELVTARGAIADLENRLEVATATIEFLRLQVDNMQRDLDDPPGYLQDRVIRKAGLGGMAEELQALRRQLNEVR